MKAREWFQSILTHSRRHHLTLPAQLVHLRGPPTQHSFLGSHLDSVPMRLADGCLGISARTSSSQNYEEYNGKPPLRIRLVDGR